MDREPVLSVNHLSVALPGKKGRIPILRDVSIHAEAGQILGLVGESGSGKSMTAFAVTRLLPGGLSSITGGTITLDGKNLNALSEKEMEHVRGRDISMIFQEPMTSLNPVFTIGRQMTDVIMTHEAISRKEAMEKAKAMLESVRIRNADNVLRCYPYELSGGMRQRVMIGIALSLSPKLLIADEPTTALDVTVQAQILFLLKEACARMGMAVIFISHDLGVISQICDAIAVMYSGHIVEYGKAADVLANPEHPYTKALIASVPSFTGSAGRRLYAIPGMVPDPSEKMKGCRFAPRCPYATAICRGEVPSERTTARGHMVYCHLYEEAGA